jgi:hypothetical protein
VTYRLTSAAHDVTINGEVYTASPITRGSVVVTSDAGKSELVVTMPVAHAIAQRTCRTASRRAFVMVTVYRQQPTAGFEQWCKGYATSIAADGGRPREPTHPLAHRRCYLRRKLPVIGAGKSCPHMLYDAQCGVVRSRVRDLDDDREPLRGRRSRSSSAAPFIGQQQFAQYGELVHVPTGERRPIYDQVERHGSHDRQCPIRDRCARRCRLVYAGCDHSVETCQAKFTKRRQLRRLSRAARLESRSSRRASARSRYK